MNRHFVALLAVCCACPAAEVVDASGSDVAQAIRDAKLDSEACYRVRDLNFNKEDAKFYLTDGFLIFSQPVQGRRLFAVFSADVEAGDAEVLLMPPYRSERRSLASFAGSPNLDAHFKSAMFVFADMTGDELIERARSAGKNNVEMGALMNEKWSPAAHNIITGFAVRLIQDLLNPDRAAGIFFAAIGSTDHGNFDVMHDPLGRDQIVVGKYTTVREQPTFDIWTSFQCRSVRSGRRKPPKPKFELTDYRIDVTLDAALHMQAVTRAKLTTLAPLRAFDLQVADSVTITAVMLDGKPIQLYTRESARDTAIRGSGSDTFLAIAPEPILPGQPHEIEIRHHGNVIVDAGNDVYYVASRATWYPRTAYTFANYDLTFRYPKRLTLVGTGEPVDDRVEGDFRISRRKTSSPVGLAGFNLGVYDHVKLARSAYSVEMFGNRTVESELQPKAQQVMIPTTPVFSRRQDVMATVAAPPIRPASRLSEMAENIGGAFDFMRAEFGLPSVRWLTVSPIPGAFGQGFPGLVYLSTLAYLRPQERPANLRNKADDQFFADILPAHEVAHQWWGNTVTSAGYPDDWLMEALANYSSLLYLEKRHGSKALDQLMESFQAHLLTKNVDGNTIESAGPITLGVRLQTSKNEMAWRIITYEKGTWILHMLRRRLGDEAFHKMLNEICRRYATEPLTTELFRKTAEEFMGTKGGSEPLAEFFETWVYGTGIPTLKLSSSVHGKAPALRLTGTLTQSGVADDFAADVPVEIQFAKGPAITRWVRTSNEASTFSVALKQAPLRVVVPCGTGILAIRK